ncbi:hypothetical protein, partial [Pseudomonas viridiflava]
IGPTAGCRIDLIVCPHASASLAGAATLPSCFNASRELKTQTIRYREKICNATQEMNTSL